MQITKKLYIPDQKTYETNQAGQLTSAQKSKLGKIIESGFDIRRPVDRFVWHSKDGFYNFKKNHVNFYSGTHPFVGQNATFFPDGEYKLNLLMTFNQDSIFLSAKTVQLPSNDNIYQTMVAALASRFNFSSEDLVCNKSQMFSPTQLKSIRKTMKEYDPEPNIGTFDFIYMGSKTMEQFPEHLSFTINLSPYYHDSPGVLFFNVKYRVFYEGKNLSFLCIEPMEILDSNLYEPDITHSHKEENNAFIFNAEKLYAKKKRDKKLGCSFYFFLISIAALYIAFVQFDSKINISTFSIGLSIIWFAIVIAERYTKSRD